MLGINKLSLQWHAAPQDENARFHQLFGVACHVHGDVYLKDSWAARRTALEGRMALRGSHLSSEVLTEEPANRQERREILLQSACPSSRKHGLMYEKLCSQRPPEEQAKPYFSDWEQHPEMGCCQPGSSVPCFLTHGFPVEHTSARMLTMRERYAVHGWGTLPDQESRPFASDILEIIAGSGCASQAATFVGNSMHIPTIMAVILYGFCHVSKADVAWKLNRKGSAWHLETSAGHAEDPMATEPSLQPSSSSPRKRRPSVKSKAKAEAAAWKRAKSTTFDE